MPTSATYRQIVAKAELPSELALNNEPHHMQFVNNNTVVVAGGLLSLLTHPQELFFWDVTNPTRPTFIKAENPPTSSSINDIIALPQGGFIVSIMGAMDGTSPGAVGEWDAKLNFVGEYPPVGERPANSNPHGISLNPELDTLVTSDFLDPASSLLPSTSVLFRNTVRIWKPWSQRRISSTVTIPYASGLTDVKFIPHNKDGLAYTSATVKGGMVIFAINTSNSQASQVFNVSQYFSVNAQRDFLFHYPSADGTRLVFTMSFSGLVAYFDIKDPVKPVLLDSLAFGIQSGIHAIDLSDDSKYIAVSGYLLNEDDFGLIHEDGDRSVHIVQIVDDSLAKTDFNVNMNTAVSYPMRPHMIRFFNTRTTTRPM
eukprot:TRINITY_DN882_c0_g1_i1.p1 TRINITY_DN882_c0_g1~~TRINITY_DN882_c0_g1_i1.p1  ORF type:complete len:370 (-),score=61.64 TRINITY_DN882_c0_g1_i1:99-1208(-)